MEFQKIVNLLNTNSDDKDLPRFITKKWIEVYDESKKKKITALTKRLELKHSTSLTVNKRVTTHTKAQSNF